MTTFKCKICGGELNVTEGMKICECEYCGTKQTLPTLDDEKKTNLFNRANKLRMVNEFDKAAGIYESIAAEFKNEAEAYWGLCLCEYGIEYVDDPKTAEKIPTCHRTSFESILECDNYKKVLSLSDSISVELYEKEAKQIDELQKDILGIVKEEKPFDVFICYKETDSNNDRTQDSVLAEDIYEKLTEKGFKVFFSRITLEDKLGREYEPYIFAALNSAKVMLAIGTNDDYYNAVWVKNEWARYLNMMKKDKSKTLIPCYKDMEPYDLPVEFKNLQGQDMSKVGFIQDLIRGINKVIRPEDQANYSAKVSVNNQIVDTMLERAEKAMVLKHWDTAIRCYDSALDYDENNGHALLGKLMASNKVNVIDDLINCSKPVDEFEEYKMLLELNHNDGEISKLKEINTNIKDRIKNDNKKKKTKNVSISIALVLMIVFCISSFFVYQYIIYPNQIYNESIELYNNGEYEQAQQYFETLEGYKESETYIYDCANYITLEINDYEKAKEYYLKYFGEMEDDECDYAIAMLNIENKKYTSAIRIFTEECPNYKDSQYKSIECYYLNGCALLEKGYYLSAKQNFKKCMNYKDAAEKINICEQYQ